MIKKKHIKLVLYIKLGLIAMVAIIVFFVFNKPHRDVAQTAPAFSLSATELFNNYDANEAASNKKYLDKVLQVEGKVLEIILENPAKPEAVFTTENAAGTVTCGFKPEELEKVKAIKIHSTITIKGECKGFNNSGDILDLLSEKDVLFSKCIIIDHLEKK
jgi:hypothetical protein